jgi:formylglycine-generating enzyme required for sulfatase activity
MSNLFISIPETTLPGGLTVPAFQVGQYVCSQGNDGKATVTAEGKPWVSINYHDARKACEAAGFKLLTESQWLAIAWNASQQDCNWTKGKVGQGKLFMGLRKNSVSSGQAGTFEPSNKNERRWLTLSNGERICDLNGNVWQRIFDDVQGDENGLVARAFTGDSPSIATAPFPSLEKGMGWRPSAGFDGSGRALIRGGSWGSERNAGAFSLNGDWPGNGWDGVGFRCTL